MCDEPTKKFIRETVEGNTNRIKYDLLRSIDVVRGIAEAVEKNVTEINGTVKTHNSKIRAIEDHILTKETLKDYIKKKEQEDMTAAFLAAEEANARNRRMQWIIAGIVGVGMAVVSLITWLL